MKIVKKVVMMLLCYVLVLGSLPVMAFTYPREFWPINEQMERAVSANDYNGMITYGKQLIDILKRTEEGSEKKNAMIKRYSQIAMAYEALGDYENSRVYNQHLFDYAGQFGEEFHDYVRVAKAKTEQFATSVELYTTGGTSPYYGAKNEKQNGVLFGLCADGQTRSKLGNESMILVYQELGQTLLAYNAGIISKAANSGVAVEFALNCPREGTDIANIRQMESYLKSISDLFKKYPNVPIYLRFAAEFDVWDNKAEPRQYIEAFRYVTNYIKSKNANVAMVWSPAQESSMYVNRDDYYPGDEYVDWVGVSLYAQKYFQGNPNAKKDDEILFKTGVNSDPVVAIKNLVETYGNRKPIMISESGCGHKMVKSGENTETFAIRRLQEYLSYLPMVYPQIKVMAYFDAHVTSDKEKSDYRLSSNANLQQEYLRLVKQPRFIQDQYSNNTDYCYRKVQDGINLSNTFEVACYAHKYNADIKTVTYFIDDKYMSVSDSVPFAAFISAKQYAGRHNLKAVVSFDDGTTMTKTAVVNIAPSGGEISVTISGRKVNFDQEPIIYNERTMVPMRKIFESLGATVSWNYSTQRT
ncbi:MAG: hypothetical protein E7403_06825, partial [Ruminococcaceae bacterium]|nr:hypothetical protein [Oscillospiraceae bacterium]